NQKEWINVPDLIVRFKSGLPIHYALCRIGEKRGLQLKSNAYGCENFYFINTLAATMVLNQGRIPGTIFK
ncbi:hypothetical protein, partial [Duncaniella muris]